MKLWLQKWSDVIIMIVVSTIVIYFFVNALGCCPKPPVTLIPTPIEAGCKLPDLGVLPTPKAKAGCFDIDNQKALAERDGRMKLWIREVRARCGR